MYMMCHRKQEIISVVVSVVIAGILLSNFETPTACAAEQASPTAPDTFALANAHNSTVLPWQTPLKSLLLRAPKTRDAVYAFLDAQQKRVEQNGETNEKQQIDWKAIDAKLRAAETLLESPFAADRREALDSINREANKLGVALPASPIVAQIAEGFLLPYLTSARSEASYEISQPQLLQNISVFYLNAGQTVEQRMALRALILAPLPGDVAVADWARFQLAQSFSRTKQWGEAVAMLENIKSESLKDGAQQLAAQWRKEHLKP